MTDQALPTPVKYRSWNVLSLAGKNEESKRHLLCYQVGLYGFHLVCLQETRIVSKPDYFVPNWGKSKWSDLGETRGCFYHFANSSTEVTKTGGKAGVGFAWRHEIVRCREFWSISSRLCWGLFEPQRPGGSKSFIALSCYALTKGNKEETMKFYLDLDFLLVKLKKRFKKQHFYIAGHFNTSFGDSAIYLGKPITHFHSARANMRTNWNARKFLQFVKRKGFRAVNIEKKCAKQKKDEVRSSEDTWSHPKTKCSSLKDLLITSSTCYKQVQLCTPLGPWHRRMLSDHCPIMWELDRETQKSKNKTRTSRPTSRREMLVTALNPVSWGKIKQLTVMQTTRDLILPWRN